MAKKYRMSTGKPKQTRAAKMRRKLYTAQTGKPMKRYKPRRK